jgi:hypothetical protein
MHCHSNDFYLLKMALNKDLRSLATGKAKYVVGILAPSQPVLFSNP